MEKSSNSVLSELNRDVGNGSEKARAVVPSSPLRLSDAPPEFRQFVTGVTLIACALQSTTGWHCGVLSGTMQMIVECFKPTIGMVAVLGISGMLGTFVGGFFVGQVVDRFGRRRSLLIYCFSSAICTCLIVYASNLVYLIIIRFCIGTAIALYYSTFPALVGELAPPRSRGKMLALVEACWFVGFCLSVSMAWVLHSLTARPAVWKYVHSFPTLVQVAMGFFAYFRLPETPAWLLSRGRHLEARHVCEYYMNCDCLLTMAEPALGSQVRGWGWSILCGETQWVRTVFGCVYWSFLVLPSFPIITYCLDYLQTMGVRRIYFFNFLISLASIPGVYGACFVVEKIGRRGIAIPQFVFSSIALLVLGGWKNPPPQAVCVLLITYNVFNASGAVLTSLYPAELFPTHVRGAGAGLMASVSRAFAMVGTFAMPFMLSELDVQTITLVFGILLAFGALITYFLAPETRGLTLAQAVNNETSMSDQHPAP